MLNTPIDPPGAPVERPTPAQMKRRLKIYVIVILGVTALAWGGARLWDWSLHQPALFHYRRGMALSNEGNVEEALQEWQSAMQREPWWPEPYFRMAEDLQALGQPDAAVLVLKRVAEAAPNAPHLTCRIAQGHALMQDQPGASEWASSAIKKEPECSLAHLMFARTRTGQLADALKHYEIAHKLSGDDAILLELAKVQGQSGDLKASEATVATYLTRHPASEETHYLQGYVLARRAQDAPGVSAAAGHLEAVLAANPARYDAHAELGLLYERRRDWTKARHHFERARELNPHSATILFHLATVLRQVRDPQAPKLWDQVRLMQAKEQRWRKARTELLTRPNDVPLLVETAQLSFDLGAPQVALTLARSALLKDPINPQAKRLLEAIEPTEAPVPGVENSGKQLDAKPN